jgi:dUTP pyrophosphatase
LIFFIKKGKEEMDYIAYYFISLIILYLFHDYRHRKKIPMLKFRKLDEKAKAPERSTEGAIGYDLFSIERGVVKPHGRRLIRTGLQLEIPEGHYGRVASRSGIAVDCGINVGAGVIDVDYTGESRVLLFNHSDDGFQFDYGSKIAQLILERASIAQVKEIFNENEMKKTVRSDSGFGSTGMGVTKKEK